MSRQSDDCGSTASAPVDHYVYAETFGHVCTLKNGHASAHQCRCSVKWKDAKR